MRPRALPGAARYVATMSSVDELAATYADLVCETFPIRATFLGRHDQDHRLGEHTAALIEGFGARVRGLRTALARTGDDGLDARALDAALGTELLEVDTEQQWRRNPDVLVDNTLSGCATLLLRDTAPLDDRLGALSDRLAAIPAYLESARRTWSDVPRFWSQAGAETSRDGAVFLRDDLPGALAGASPAIARSVCEAAARGADAFDALADHLVELPDGGSWMAGEAAVSARLRVQHQLADGPARIAARGEALVAETIAELEELDPSWRDLIAREKARHPEVGELLSRYVDEMERARVFVEEHGIAGATPTPLDVRASPRFWADLVPYAAYDAPGYFQPDAPGVFWVTVPDGDDAPERLAGHAVPSIVLTVVHEGYPGHHLQLTRANRAGLVAALVDSPLLAEGWAFYCEEMLGEVGYYGDDPVLRAFQLKDQLWRAVRVVVDIGLHCGELDVDAAVDQLVRVADLERPSAVAEVRRYTSSPTYQICYAIGKQEILTLREQCRATDQGFSLGTFHDELLSYGTLPVPMIASAMLASREPTGPGRSESPQ
jgi:hypothetical protein